MNLASNTLVSNNFRSPNNNKNLSNTLQNNGQPSNTPTQILPVIKLDFRVRFYPENVEQDLVQNITQRLFFAQVRDQVLSGSLVCCPEMAVKLAAYSCQIMFGDWEAIHDKFYNHNYHGHHNSQPSDPVNFDPRQNSNHKLNVNSDDPNLGVVGGSGPISGTTTPKYDYQKIYNHLAAGNGGRLVSEKVRKNLQDSAYFDIKLGENSEPESGGLGSSNHNLQAALVREEQVKIKLITHVIDQYQGLAGILPDELIVRYLTLAQTLTGYGTTYWPVSSNCMEILEQQQRNLEGSKTNLNNIETSRSKMSSSIINLEKLTKRSTKNVSNEHPTQYWLGVNQKGIFLYENQDHEKTQITAEWRWPEVADLEH